MNPILTINDLRVRRSLQFALTINSLRIRAGNTVCIVGPNGSGKTTLLECITGLLAPTSGTICIDNIPVNQNLRSTKRTLGYIPDDENWLVKELCAREYFALLEGVYRQAGVTCNMKARAKHLATLLHFTAFEQQLQRLSHGNKKKAQIIAGLMHMPTLIVMDEIRNGLDPLAIIATESLIRQEVHRGASIIAATHDLWWAERIANEVVLLIGGKIAIHKETEELTKRYGSLEELFVKTLSAQE